MANNYYLLPKNLFCKVALIVIFMSWGYTNLHADSYTETLTFSGSAPSGWHAADSYAFTNDELTPSGTWGTATIISDSKINLESGQRIVITARATYASGTAVKYFASTTTTFSSSTTFNNTYFPDQENYYELEISITSDQEKYIKINCCRAVIKRIEFKAVSGETIDEVILDETGATSTDFSSLVSATSVPSVKVIYTPKSGWNTICMPFQLKGSIAESTYMSTIFGSGWRAYGFYSYSDGVLNFSQRSGNFKMFENTPYLVYSENPQTPPSGGFSFTDVEITYSTTRRTTANGITFQGTYSPMAAGTLTDKYGVTTSNKLAKGSDRTTMKGYRAYLSGLPTGTGATARIIVIDGDDETTDIEGLSKIVDDEFIGNGSSTTHRAYNLQGQQIRKGSKGIYIVNGKKIVVK